MHKITAVKALKDYRLDLRFDDGVTGTVDLSDLVGQGVFASWCDTKVFDSVRIGSSGELVWGDQIDLCPDSLYLKVTGKTANEVFPGLHDLASHA